MLPLFYLAFAPAVYAHVAAWNKGMYCFNGTSGMDDPDTTDAVGPLFKLPRSKWWMHHVNKCDEFPPAPGDFLELPAGSSFTVELAGSRAQTSFSYDGQKATDWADGKEHEDGWNAPNCPATQDVHAQNKTMAAGTVFAISYHSDIKEITPENLVVFTVKYHTPWRRVTTYDVPTNLPACPPEGCHCVWGWVPNHCGQQNMYMLPYKCIVTNSTSLAPLAPAQPPKWCEDDRSQCVQGAKQMIFWKQLDGNNVVVTGNQTEGNEKSPGYNWKMNFKDGAQNDIFLDSVAPVKRHTRPRPRHF